MPERERAFVVVGWLGGVEPFQQLLSASLAYALPRSQRGSNYDYSIRGLTNEARPTLRRPIVQRRRLEPGTADEAGAGGVVRKVIYLASSLPNLVVVIS